MASQVPVSHNSKSNQIKEDQGPPQGDIKSMNRITGTVKWYNVKKGFGFITRHDTGEDIFVHKTAIVRPNRNHFSKSIGDGEIVEFGLIASKVTGPGFKSVKGSPFVAKRQTLRSQPTSGNSELSMKNISKNNSVGMNKLEKPTKKVSIKSDINGIETKNSVPDEQN